MTDPLRLDAGGASSSVVVAALLHAPDPSSIPGKVSQFPLPPAKIAFFLSSRISHTVSSCIPHCFLLPHLPVEFAVYTALSTIFYIPQLYKKSTLLPAPPKRLVLTRQEMQGDGHTSVMHPASEWGRRLDQQLSDRKKHCYPLLSHCPSSGEGPSPALGPSCPAHSRQFSPASRLCPPPPHRVDEGDGQGGEADGFEAYLCIRLGSCQPVLFYN